MTYDKNKQCYTFALEKDAISSWLTKHPIENSYSFGVFIEYEKCLLGTNQKQLYIEMPYYNIFKDYQP